MIDFTDRNLTGTRGAMTSFGGRAFILASGLACATPAYAATFKTLYSLSGNSGGKGPAAALVQNGNLLYGTTYDGGKSLAGTIFSFDPATKNTTIVYSFSGGADGSSPYASITFSGGRLYGTTYGGGSFDTGTAFAFDPVTGTKTTYSFTQPNGGSRPFGGLTGLGGLFYGTTFAGGTSGNGTVFKFDPVNGNVQTLYSFLGSSDGSEPVSSVLALDGALYGVTSFGGAANAGTLYRISASGKVTTIYSFPGGENGGVSYANLINIGKKLYGTTSGYGKYGYGTVFEFDLETGTERTIYAFSGKADGGAPFGGVVENDGKLYGTTCSTELKNGQAGGGSVYEVDIATGAETTLYDFTGYKPSGTTGNCPQASLVLDGTALYGTAVAGGTSNGGTIFSIGVSTGKFSLLHNFNGPAGPNFNSGLINLNGGLVGTSSTAGTPGKGTVFDVSHRLAYGTTLHAFTGGVDGSVPQSSLLNVAGTLYGTTSGPPGTLFSLSQAAGTETVLHTFNISLENDPRASLIEVGGLLYGTTYGGYCGAQVGNCPLGSVFSYSPSSGLETTLHLFNGNQDGRNPKAGLVNVGGVLYGTTSGLIPGGGVGTIFGINLTTKAFVSDYVFDTIHGANPVGTLIELGGLLYGTTIHGGTSGSGTVFSFDPVSGNVASLHSFTGGLDGSEPQSGLTLFRGRLIGTASTGGANSAGTVFEINPATGAETTLYSFTGGADGGTPTAPIMVLNGVLYGTSASGGAGGRGTVFSLQP